MVYEEGLRIWVGREALRLMLAMAFMKTREQVADFWV